jgi:ABC-type sugar transport system ATPase subunit
LTPAISATGLIKDFGSTRALDRLDLAVRCGELHGSLGPNGAGKTTTIRVLLGLLRRDAGDVRLLGGDPWRDAVALHRRLAYVPGEANLWPNLTGGEVIDLLGALRGGLDRMRRVALLERFQLDPTKQCRAWRTSRARAATLRNMQISHVRSSPDNGLRSCAREAPGRRQRPGAGAFFRFAGRRNRTSRPACTASVPWPRAGRAP